MNGRLDNFSGIHIQEVSKEHLPPLDVISINFRLLKASEAPKKWLENAGLNQSNLDKAVIVTAQVTDAQNEEVLSISRLCARDPRLSDHAFSKAAIFMLMEPLFDLLTYKNLLGRYIKDVLAEDSESSGPIEFL